jgi:hypothetical protein
MVRHGAAWSCPSQLHHAPGHDLPGWGHPVLSGDVGRKFLEVLIRLAATNYRKRPAVFAWAKAKAEDVHRRNIERISGFPAERTDILIDEALLERHLRGDAGKGDLELSLEVFCGDRAEMAALAASSADRLEYLLERAKRRDAAVQEQEGSACGERNPGPEPDRGPAPIERRAHPPSLSGRPIG